MVVDLWSEIKQYLKLSLELTKLSLLSELEYRLSFAIKVLGIFANNFTFYLVWILYFDKFPSLNGWTIKETMLLLALASVGYGWVLVFLRGLTQIAKTVSRGELDYFLSLPVNPLWLLAVFKSEIGALGDILFGLFVLALFPNLTGVLIVKFLVLAFLSGLVFASFLIITQSLAFYVPNFEDAAEQLWWSMVAFCWYPQSVFDGLLRGVVLTIFPAFFMFTLPVQLFFSFSWVDFLLLLSFTLLLLALAIKFFQHSLRHYESGNLIAILR